MLAISTAHRAARNAASIALADAKTEAAQVLIYTADGGTLLAVRRLAKPCGTINGDGRIVLQAAVANDLVLASGSATWAAWCDGDGVPIAAGAVTDEAGEGPFKLGGTVGTALYAGGVVVLGSSLLG